MTRQIRDFLQTASACLLFLITLVVNAAAQPPSERATVHGIVATPAGRPVAGVEVCLYLLKADYKHVAASARARTGADGHYTISVPTPARSTIEIVKSSTQNSVGFETAGFGDSVRVILRPRGDFKIRLRDLSNHGVPVAGVVVHPTWMICSTESRMSGDVAGGDDAPWSPDVAPEFRATTDANGNAIIHGFPLGVATGIETEGSPYVQVGAPDDTAESILGVAGNTVHTLDVCRAGSVSGQVIYAASGKPAADVCVQAYQGSQSVEPTAYTDNEGRYEIDGLTLGAYTVVPIAINEEQDVDNPGPGDWAARGKLVSVSLNQPNSSIDFSLEQGGIVSGTVYNDHTGAPADDEFVGARIAGSPLQTQMTDNVGHYAMRLPAGPAIIVPVDSQFNIDVGVRQNIIVRNGGTTNVNLSVNGRDEFNFASGIVLGDDNKPAAGASVIALGQYDGGTTADTQGRFTFSDRDMPPSSESLRASWG